MSTFRFNTTFTPTKGLPVTWVGGVRKARDASGALVDFASLDATARDAAKVAISADADLVQRHVSAAMTTLDPAPPAGIYEMEAWEDGQSMDEEPCALSVNQVYWDGTGEMSPNATAYITPLQAVLYDPTEPTLGPTVYLYRNAAFGTKTFTITDKDGEPVNLSGKSISFVAWKQNDEEALWKISDCTVGGDDNNVVIASQDDANTGTAGIFRYTLWNETDDAVLVTGRLEILKNANSVIA